MGQCQTLAILYYQIGSELAAFSKGAIIFFQIGGS